MLDTIINPRHYFSSKPLGSNLNPLAQHQRSGLEVPPEAHQYLADLMETTEDTFLGTNHPNKSINIKDGLSLLTNTQIPTFKLISIQPTGVEGRSFEGLHTVFWQRNNTPCLSSSSAQMVWCCTKQFVYDYVTIPSENGRVLTPAMVVAKSLIKTISLFGHKCG